MHSGSALALILPLRPHFASKIVKIQISGYFLHNFRFIFKTLSTKLTMLHFLYSLAVFPGYCVTYTTASAPRISSLLSCIVVASRVDCSTTDAA